MLAVLVIDVFFHVFPMNYEQVETRWSPAKLQNDRRHGITPSRLVLIRIKHATLIHLAEQVGMNPPAYWLVA